MHQPGIGSSRALGKPAGLPILLINDISRAGLRKAKKLCAVQRIGLRRRSTMIVGFVGAPPVRLIFSSFWLFGRSRLFAWFF